jgi:alanine racemase
MYLYKSHRPTWAEIDMDAIKNNYLELKKQCPESTIFMGVVKADAYGHGAVTVSQELLRLGVEYLAVSNIDEGIELRSSGISLPVLLFGPVETVEFGKLIEFNIYPTVISIEYAKELSEAYRYRGIYPKVHIKIDTGMGRIGIPVEKALMGIEQISKMEGIIVDGVYTHFPSADDDIEFSHHQLKLFIDLISELKKLDIKIRHFHIANSAAIFNIPMSTQPPLTMVRPGLALYGYSSKPRENLQNSMTLKTKIVSISCLKKGDTVSYLRTYEVTKEREFIAVLPAGYADGIPTLYSNKGNVYIKGKPYPVVGRVCMDYMMVSLGESPGDIMIGDEAIIFGNGSISVEKFGTFCRRVPYEVTCDISKRVPRIYLRKEDKR